MSTIALVLVACLLCSTVDRCVRSSVHLAPFVVCVFVCLCGRVLSLYSFLSLPSFFLVALRSINYLFLCMVKVEIAGRKQKWSTILDSISQEHFLLPLLTLKGLLNFWTLKRNKKTCSDVSFRSGPSWRRLESHRCSVLFVVKLETEKPFMPWDRFIINSCRAITFVWFVLSTFSLIWVLFPLDFNVDCAVDCAYIVIHLCYYMYVSTKFHQK